MRRFKLKLEFEVWYSLTLSLVINRKQWRHLAKAQVFCASIYSDLKEIRHKNRHPKDICNF